MLSEVAEATPELVDAIQKLRHCQDPTTGSRSFILTIRLEFEDDSAKLYLEESAVETDEGSSIDLRVLRSQQ